MASLERWWLFFQKCQPFLWAIAPEKADSTGTRTAKTLPLYFTTKFDWVRFLIWMNLQRRQRHPTPVLLPGKSHGRRSVVGCSPRGCKESDMTELLHFHFSFSSIGEGNGNPLQCSCLENPRDGGAWWAAVYGIA